MREGLVDLIGRMTTKEPRCLNSDDSIRWHACREAETLADPSMVDELADYVRHEPNKDCRDAAYFILGKLGQKVRSAECASILLFHVSSEKNKYVLAGLLGRLGDVRKPKELDLGPIFQLRHDERWRVLHSAIQARKLTDSQEAEGWLLELLQTTDDPNDVTYCHATLSEIGTAKALPFIRKNLKSRKRDVRASAQWAIEAINARMRGEIAIEHSTLHTPYGPS